MSAHISKDVPIQICMHSYLRNVLVDGAGSTQCHPDPKTLSTQLALPYQTTTDRLDGVYELWHGSYGM